MSTTSAPTRAEKRQESKQLNAFYRHLKTEAIQNVPEFHYIPHSCIKTAGNSKEYPDSISVNVNDILLKDNCQGVVLVRYDKDNHYVGRYALTLPQLMEVYGKAIADNQKVMCEKSARISRSAYLDGDGDLYRIKWQYLSQYAF